MMRRTTQLSLLIGSILAMNAALAQEQATNSAEANDRNYSRTDSRTDASNNASESASTSGDENLYDRTLARETPTNAQDENSDSGAATGDSAADANRRQQPSAQGATHTYTDDPVASTGASRTTTPDAASTASNTTTATSERTNEGMSATATAATDTNEAANAQQQSGDAQKQTTQRTRTAAAGQQGASSGQPQSGQVAAIPVITVLVPVAMESKADSGLANGCWAKLYGDAGFKGDSLTLVGPVDMPDMRGPFGHEWGGVSSIKAGPNATVTIYDNANFEDKAATVRPREQVKEISSKMGFFEDVNSIRINCQQGGSTSSQAGSTNDHDASKGNRGR